MDMREMRGMTRLLVLSSFSWLPACDGGGLVGYRSHAAGDAAPTDTSTDPYPEVVRLTPEGCDHEVTFPGIFAPEDGALTYGPSPEPAGIHLSFPGSGDASTTIAFSWRTDLETMASSVELGTDADALDRVETGWTLLAYQGTAYDDNLIERRLHEVQVCGLTPATTYHYRVGGEGGWSDVHSFRTAPAAGAATPIRFAVVGDSRTHYDTTWAEVAQAIDAYDPAFVVHSGDAVDYGYRIEEWDMHFDNGADLFPGAPFLHVNGNHEDNALVYYAEVALAGNEQWYDVRYGNLHFVGLNDWPTSSPTIEGAQRDFLEEILCGTDANWTFAMHHRPPYSSAPFHGPNPDLQDAWVPIFDSCGLDIDIAGHDHVYERTLPMFEGTPVATPAEGTIYTISAGGGASLYEAGSGQPWTHVTESVNSFVIVDVDGDTLRWRAYRIEDGVESLLDPMTLEKDR